MEVKPWLLQCHFLCQRSELSSWRFPPMMLQRYQNMKAKPQMCPCGDNKLLLTACWFPFLPFPCPACRGIDPVHLCLTHHSSPVYLVFLPASCLSVSGLPRVFPIVCLVCLTSPLFGHQIPPMGSVLFSWTDPSLPAFFIPPSVCVDKRLKCSAFPAEG